MGVLGISLIAATVVLFCLRPPGWFSVFFRNLQQSRLGPPPQPPLIQEPEDDESETHVRSARADSTTINGIAADGAGEGITLRRLSTKAETDRFTIPPPARPPVVQLATEEEKEEEETALGKPRTSDSAYEEQTTPKASAVQLNADAVPQFSLSIPEPSKSLSSSSSFSNGAAPPRLNPPTFSGLMAPPPRPVPASLLRPHQPGSSTLPPAPSGPLPNRGAPSSSSSLFPPPTLLAKPQKPSKQIALAPGHSPLDWARLSSNPSANLRGLPPNTPYLKVTPSMLKKMTGRKGKDAWTVLGGRVYNMSPYIPFHPGGEPELLRGAGRDGTKLFGEIHPWVNYEGMLAACLIGIYVPEEEAKAEEKARGGSEYDMEAMD